MGFGWGFGTSAGARPAALLACALAAWPLAAPAQQPSAPPPSAASVADDGALKADHARTRFIIGLERQVDFQVFALTNPNRVFVELPDIKLQLPLQPDGAPVGLVKSFRGGLSAPGKARVVIDVTGPVIVEKSAIEKPKDGKTPRLVLEIASAEAMETKAPPSPAKRPVALPGSSGLGAAGLQPPMPRPAVSPQVRALSMYKPVIVIDPGHGGDDTGAQRYGTVEKNVVLAFSLMLREKLEATRRYKVLLTRETDTFVELQERRAFAERNNANLFIAVHADYAKSTARGATIYSLRQSVANALQRSAKGEVASNVLSGHELAAVKRADGDVGTVKEILADLARREVEMTRERTGVLARSVIEFMSESTNLKDNPDRSAAFIVLKTAKVPSILIELGYVTNEEDAEQLKSEAWRDKVSTSILTAIENYFTHQLARLPL
jgi:N-acetylmuramoyl-L-alanine amidase